MEWDGGGGNEDGDGKRIRKKQSLKSRTNFPTDPPLILTCREINFQYSISIQSIDKTKPVKETRRTRGERTGAPGMLLAPSSRTSET